MAFSSLPFSTKPTLDIQLAIRGPCWTYGPDNVTVIYHCYERIVNSDASLDAVTVAVTCMAYPILCVDVVHINCEPKKYSASLCHKSKKFGYHFIFTIFANET